MCVYTVPFDFGPRFTHQSLSAECHPHPFPLQTTSQLVITRVVLCLFTCTFSLILAHTTK
jgi:hypothetical protein